MKRTKPIDRLRQAQQRAFLTSDLNLLHDAVKVQPERQQEINQRKRWRIQVAKRFKTQNQAEYKAQVLRSQLPKKLKHKAWKRLQAATKS